MTKKVYVSQSDIEHFVERYVPSSGCTAVYLDDSPKILRNSGFKSRSQANPERFSYQLGITISIDKDRPDDIYIGDSSLDAGDSYQPDEDMYVLNRHDGSLTKMQGNEIGRYNPKYANAHHGDKKYFEVNKLIRVLNQCLKTHQL